ncbi:hypothetical protein [Nostoc sp. UHCC 0251]|uniref:hypothetical protein n=1 Tax=Nostoc sp. UHCC 0251 TaxID=3110240 RepID=UPI002B1F6FCF|nr:hypothetical protein [Nostoc sp. UHCC 0251]MEA5622619.1 hypothetical protein [Nostoc sp. UHCC 0251]
MLNKKLNHLKFIKDSTSVINRKLKHLKLQMDFTSRINKKLKYLVKLSKTNLIVKLCCLFLATDITFILLDLFYTYSGLTSNSNFSLGQDRGYSEIFQYLKEYWSALLLGFLALKNRSFLYLTWSVMFFYLLLDDAMQIHERLGNLISNEFSFVPMFYLRAIDFGELAVSAIVGLLFLIAITITYGLGDRFAREVSRYLTILLFALAFFGIIVDMIHLVFSTSLLEPLLNIVEDGGELMVMSLIICFVFSLSLQSKKLIE